MYRTLFFVFFLFAAFVPAVYADGCCSWQNTNAIFAGDLGQYYPISLTFDANTNKMALLTWGNFNQTYTLALWYYDGNNWEEAWQGDPQTTFLPIPPLMLYYDYNINSLVSIGFVRSPSGEGGGLEAFRYDPSNGFEVVENAGIFGGPSAPSLSISYAYDTIRKRVVIPRASDQDYITAEFDGHQFYEIQNAPGVILYSGIAGYNPDTRRVVFFGFNGFHDSNPTTWEYDGNTWVQVQTVLQPNFSYSYHAAGMTYMPKLHALLALDYSDSSLETWLYGSSWKIIQPSNSPTQAISSLMSINPLYNAIIDYNVVNVASFYNITMELKLFHCRPVAKP